MPKRSYTTKNWNQGEEHTVVEKITDSVGNAVDVSGATITLWCKRLLNTGTTYLFQKTDVDFTKNVDGNSNWVSCVFDEDDLNFSGVAYVITEFEITAGSNVKKTIFRVDLETTPEGID
jgi:transposase